MKLAIAVYARLCPREGGKEDCYKETEKDSKKDGGRERTRERSFDDKPWVRVGGADITPIITKYGDCVER